MNAHTKPQPETRKPDWRAPTATFAATDLRRAVALAAQAVERRSTIPILGTIRIGASPDGAIIRGTDLDIEVFAYLDTISAHSEIDLTICPRLMANLVRFADGEVTIRQDGDIVTIIADDVEATIRSLCDPRTDWPALATFDSDQVFLSEATLQRAMAATMRCISTEETRYYLNGIYWHKIDSKLCLVTTDGHRLAKYQTAEDWPFEGLILPRPTAELLNRCIRKGGNAHIIAMAAGNKAEFRGQGWKIVSKTIDGTFPDYTRVIPQAEPKITATLTHHALRRFGDMSERVRAIKIDPVAGRMSYSMPDGPTISMPVQATGDQAIGFNLGYLRDFTATAGTIRLETSSPGDPARVLTDDPALLQVLMPMRI